MTNDDLSKFSKILDTKLEPIQKLLESHDKTLEKHSTILEKHSTILNSHSKTLRSIKKTQDVMLDMLDIEQMNQRKRIVRIEKHLNLPPIT